MDNLFDDPGDLGFFDLNDETIEESTVDSELNGLFHEPSPAEGKEPADWTKDVEIVEHPGGGASFRGKLVGMGF